MKIKIITTDSARADAWIDALAADEPRWQIEAAAGPLHLAGPLAAGGLPDLLVTDTGDARDLAALEALAAAHPTVDTLLIGDDLPADHLLRAMRAGVREVLPAQAGAASLRAAAQRLWRQRPPAASAPSIVGELLAFISCKGGSGATFIAANVAHLLASSGKRVALIDLNLQFGDALLFISNERPASDVADVARNLQRLDADFLLSAMVPVAPGLHVLAAPEDPALASEVTPQQVQAILTQARTMFDYIVVDAGRSLSGVTLQALDMADSIHAVLQLTLPFIRDARRLREIFRSLGYPADKLHWIVNRCEKNGQITLDDVRATLGADRLITLPNQYDAVAASVNQGVPVADLPGGSAITRALRELAQGIAPQAAPARNGWLASLWRGGAQRHGEGARS